MFYVISNGKPASKQGYPYLKGEGWEDHEFRDLEEALNYAMNWLGPYAPSGTASLQLNKPYEYNGYGDYVMITDISIKVTGTEDEDH